jgi:Fe-S cluster biosynthesis and repair protein YggX
MHIIYFIGENVGQIFQNVGQKAEKTRWNKNRTMPPNRQQLTPATRIIFLKKSLTDIEVFFF